MACARKGIPGCIAHRRCLTDPNFTPVLQLRAIERDGQPWFLARDVAAMGFQNAPRAVAESVEAQDKHTFNVGLRGSGPEAKTTEAVVWNRTGREAANVLDVMHAIKAVEGVDPTDRPAASGSESKVLEGVDPNRLPLGFDESTGG